MLQVVMRTASLSLYARVGVEVSLMAIGSFVVYIFPPGSAKDGENWGKLLVFGSLFTIGGMAMAEGLIVNIVPGGAATVLKLLLVGCVCCVVKHWHTKRERRAASANSDTHPLNP